MITRFILEECLPWYGWPKFLTILFLSIAFFAGAIVSFVLGLIFNHWCQYLMLPFLWMAVAMFYGIGDLYDDECLGLGD